MTEVINIRFRNTGKVYFFAPGGISVQPGDFVIVETSKGLEYGECTAGNHEVNDSAIVPPLRPVIRVATEDDKRVAALNREKEAKAFNICLEKIEAHKLDMKLVDVEYSFEGNKILFFFTSDGRVDFRELVKDLVSIFRARIELRQIGVRDGAKMLGGLGICGRAFCCSAFLDDFHPVSIKMAKTQSLSLNPTKISGTCGRLMCCLKYEQDAYEDLIKNAPKVSASVVTPFGQGTVTEVNLLRQYVKVRVDEGDTTGIHIVPFVDVGKTVSSVPKEEATPAPAYTSTFIRKEREPENTRNVPAGKPENTRNAPAGRPENTRNAPTGRPENTRNTPAGRLENTRNAPTARPENTRNTPTGRPENTRNAPTGRPDNTRNTPAGRPEFRKNNSGSEQRQEPKQEQNNAKQNPKAPRPISELGADTQSEPEKIVKKKPYKRFIKKREPGDTPNQGAQNPAEGAVNKKPNGNRNNRRRHKPKPPEVS